MVLTDTHTHLYLEEFSEDLNEVVNRAFTKKVTRLFLPSICYKHYKSMLNLKNKFPNNIFLIGISNFFPLNVQGTSLIEIILKPLA